MSGGAGSTTSTRNAAAVLLALDEPRPVADIIAAAGLTEGQVRYALVHLIQTGEIVMEGAQGVRGTRYARSPR